jgi:hypothetical protein
MHVKFCGKGHSRRTFQVRNFARPVFSQLEGAATTSQDRGQKSVNSYAQGR